MKRLMAALSAVLLLAGALLAGPVANAADYAFDGNLRLNAGTATATSGAATLANKAGLVTSEALTTAAAAIYTLTVTDTVVAATDLCFANVAYGTSTTGSPAVTRVTPAAGSLVILVQNIHASAALNGTIVVGFACFKS